MLVVWVLVILQGMKDALLGNIRAQIEDKAIIPTQNEAAQYISEEDIKFAYCTEFIILSEDGDSNAFRAEIESLGDSIIAVAFEDVIKVHIHTNDPGAVLSKAVQLGELSKIKIENMKEQHRHLVLEDELVTEEVTAEETKKYGFVSVAMGEGITNIFKDLGVDIVIKRTDNEPSTQDILDAVNK